MNQQLEAVILPSLKVELEWADCEGKAPDSASIEAQKQFFREYSRKGAFFITRRPRKQNY